MNIARAALFFLLFASLSAYSQDNQDSVVIKSGNQYLDIDSLSAAAQNIATDTTTDKPNLAALYSAVLPGLGQVYNKKYWKLPIVYGGFVFFGYLIKFNHETYEEVLSALNAVSDNDDRTNPPLPYRNLNRDVLERGTEFYRRNRDFVIILTVVWYALNIIDAHVDGHLNEFTISEDLSLNIQPSIEETMFYTRNYGITLKLNF